MPLVDIFCPFVSFLVALRSPSCPFVDFFFSFVDNPQLFHASQIREPIVFWGRIGRKSRERQISTGPEMSDSGRPVLRNYPVI